MNLLNIIKNLLIRNKTKKLNDSANNNIKELEESNTNFLEDIKIDNNDAFSNLLKPDNLKKINIEEELLPYFKEVILKIRKYFIENDLMFAKNYEEFFTEYFLNKGFEIRYGTDEEMGEVASGQYYKDKNLILLKKYKNNEDLAYGLCHEFIHFLVMADSDYGLSSIPFFNEGYTDLLTSEIFNMCPKGYLNETELIKFLNSFFEEKNKGFKKFLNNEYIFESSYRNSSIIAQVERFASVKDYKGIQKEFIIKLLNIENVNSIEDYIQKVNILSNAPIIDRKFINLYFKYLNESFLNNIKIEQSPEVIELLNKYCTCSYKSVLYGDRMVCEFNIDDLIAAYDENGALYGYDEFPNGGSSYGNKDQFRMTHNGKTEYFSLKNFEGINWVEQFSKSKEALYKFFQYKESNKYR